MDILIYTLRSVAYAITDPELVLILIILAFILHSQNKKTVVMQKMIIGEGMNSPFELTISQIVIGIFAGAIGSIILSFLGVAFSEDSVIYIIFLISIFFMLWNPKYICFAYSGALLGAVSLILDIISKNYAGTSINILGNTIDIANINMLNIDIAALMTMVAVLHLIEGILVMVDGKRGAIPVFTNRDNKIIGGFALKRYWALPIALFFIVSKTGSTGLTEQVATPNWWPLLKGTSLISLMKDAALGLFAFYGVIGYNSVTFTRNKKEKTFISGTAIITYSILLFILAQVSVYGVFYKVLVLIFAPLAHELMLYYTRYLEVSGEPKYMSSDEGIMVLEVAPNSPADKMGIKSGDLLIEVNGRKIENEQDILNASKEGSNFISFKLRNVKNDIKEVDYNKLNLSKRLGIVMVPKTIPGDSAIVKLEESKFRDILNRMKDNNKDNDDDNNHE
jgi:hypothetical protein